MHVEGTVSLPKPTSLPLDLVRMVLLPNAVQLWARKLITLEQNIYYNTMRSSPSFQRKSIKNNVKFLKTKNCLASSFWLFSLESLQSEDREMDS